MANQPKDRLASGNDKYAHCMAHCQGAAIGDAEFAFWLGMGREATDLARYSCGGLGKDDEGPDESVRDVKANLRGWTSGVSGASCSEACGAYGD